MTRAEVLVDYAPRFPESYRPGIAVVGVGAIAQEAHLPGYAKYGLDVTGVYDIASAVAEHAGRTFGLPVYESFEAVLADPRVEVVDLATHPADRAPLVRMALAAGKHVLSQKPLAVDLATAQELVREAERSNRLLAVNQNGRWSPPWRIATLLVEQGLVGDVQAVTHMFDLWPYWIRGIPAFEDTDHFFLYDYSVHFFDITRCWLQAKRLTTIRARDYRTPNQVPESRTPWGAWAELEYEDGSNGFVRGPGVSTTRREGHPFWIHGSEGTIRGSVMGSDFVELEAGDLVHRYSLNGHWYPDGFAGAMGELLCAIAEAREPVNSGRHNLLSLAIALAACRSAELGGAPVAIPEEVPQE